MRLPSILIAFALTGVALAADDAPKIFEGLLKPETPVKGQIGMVIPPSGIDKYVAKVEAAARKDEKWFTQYSENSKPGLPLPYNEKLGLTKEEYAQYLKLWEQREFKPTEEVMLMLSKNSKTSWVITATGSASPLTTLLYYPKTDTFRSPNGVLKRIADIHSDPNSILGAWDGHEWKFEEENSLGTTKENIAFGKYTDGKYGLIVYRVQEMTSEGTRLLDKSLVVRFPLAKPAPSKD